MLVILGLLVLPLIRELPLGQASRTGLLAWLLVGLALYSALRGDGLPAVAPAPAPPVLRRGRLLSAPSCCSGSRWTSASWGRAPSYVARGLILVGAGCAIANLMVPCCSSSGGGRGAPYPGRAHGARQPSEPGRHWMIPPSRSVTVRWSSRPTARASTPDAALALLRATRWGRRDDGKRPERGPSRTRLLRRVPGRRADRDSAGRLPIWPPTPTGPTW